MRSLVVSVALAAACVVLLTPAYARESAARVLDRTFVCETGYLGGVYQAKLETYWFDPPQGRRLPSAVLTTSFENGFLAGVSSTSMYVNPARCKTTRVKVQLTTKGLEGGAFSPLADGYNCFTPRRVLVRVRGEFLKPTEFETASPSGFRQLQALGATKRSELAVATPKGKPIAYASTAGSKARLLTYGDCRPD